jgi:hypothetical protein
VIELGMFDYVRSSYYLGEHFSGNCQTKEIEEYGIGGTMSQYWISPDGQLYLIDYSHTADFVELKEGDDGYNDKLALLNFRWIPNGTHGKVRPWNITKYVTIYPENWNGEWEDWPDCRIHFKNGIVQNYEILTKGGK